MVRPLADAIGNILQATFGKSSKTLTVGVLLDGHPLIATSTSALGYRTIVVGDRFRLLYRTHRKIEKKNIQKPLILEASFDNIPLKQQSLDAVILSRNIFPIKTPSRILQDIRTLLKNDGLVIWPHHFPGRIRRISQLGTKPPLRSDLTSLAMEAGFAEIGQVVVSSRLVTWIVTTGRNKKCPSPTPS